MKPILIIGSTMLTSAEVQNDVRAYLQGYYVLFILTNAPNFKLLAINDTIEISDLKQLQDYLERK